MQGLRAERFNCDIGRRDIGVAETEIDDIDTRGSNLALASVYLGEGIRWE
jgi:hypothetical protein